jgi:hypothetical protein
MNRARAAGGSSCLERLLERQFEPSYVAGRDTLDLVESRGSIEFRYADGRLVSGEYADYASSPLTKGDRLDFDGSEWVLRDRVDRGGVTVYLFSPSDTSDGPPKSAQRRARRRSR